MSDVVRPHCKPMASKREKKRNNEKVTIKNRR
jgi:hypothetical protein